MRKEKLLQNIRLKSSTRIPNIYTFLFGLLEHWHFCVLFPVSGIGNRESGENLFTLFAYKSKIRKHSLCRLNLFTRLT